MLTEIGLKDFKSFAARPDGGEQRVGVAPLTLLVGANASGKSNFLDALQFLQGLALDLSVAEVLGGRYDGQREVWPGLRGGAAEAVRYGQKRFAISTRWQLADFGASQFAIACSPKRVTQEIFWSLSAASGFVAASNARDLSLLRSRAKRAKAGTAPALLHEPRRGFQGDPLLVAPFTSGANVLELSTVPGHAVLKTLYGRGTEGEINSQPEGALLRSLHGTALFDIRAARMRQYVPTSAPVLGVSGENASAILWRLCQDPARKQEIVDWIAELCAEEVADIRFDETRLKDVMLLLVEKDGSEISARSASDGTLRFLGLLLALLTAERGSTLLLEEVENGLHPARIHLLVELLERVTRENGVQVIATTHSPVVLGALSRETLGNVIAFGRHPDVPGTLMKRLAALPHFDEVVERRGIEYLFTSQWLERAL